MCGFAKLDILIVAVKQYKNKYKLAKLSNYSIIHIENEPLLMAGRRIKKCMAGGTAVGR